VRKADSVPTKNGGRALKLLNCGSGGAGVEEGEMMRFIPSPALLPVQSEKLGDGDEWYLMGSTVGELITHGQFGVASL